MKQCLVERGGATIQSTIPTLIILIFCCFANVKSGRKLKGMAGGGGLLITGMGMEKGMED